MGDFMNMLSDDKPPESGAETPESVDSAPPVPATEGTGLEASVLRLRKGQKWLTEYLDKAIDGDDAGYEKWTGILDDWEALETEARQLFGLDGCPIDKNGCHADVAVKCQVCATRGPRRLRHSPQVVDTTEKVGEAPGKQTTMLGI